MNIPLSLTFSKTSILMGINESGILISKIKPQIIMKIKSIIYWIILFMCGCASCENSFDDFLDNAYSKYSKIRNEGLYFRQKRRGGISAKTKSTSLICGEQRRAQKASDGLRLSQQIYGFYRHKHRYALLQLQNNGLMQKNQV